MICARWLQAKRGLTPCGTFCYADADDPDRFMLDPNHLLSD
jgi:hypothetical protein